MRFENYFDVSKLFGIVCLFFVCVVNFKWFCNSFMISYLWCIYIGFNFEFVFYLVDENVEVKFVYIFNNGLVVFIICCNMEWRIFLCKMIKCYIYFFLVGFRFWFNGYFDYWIRKFYLFKNGRVIGVVESVFSGCIF